MFEGVKSKINSPEYSAILALAGEAGTCACELEANWWWGEVVACNDRGVKSSTD
jgi:hypothetical protein